MRGNTCVKLIPLVARPLAHFGHQTYYQSSVLRLSGDHSTLYVAETGLSGYGSIDSYAINSSAPTYTTGYPFLLANLFDLAIDEVYQRIYSVSGGVYGVGVTDMVKGTTSTWSDSSRYASVRLCGLLPPDRYFHLRRFLWRNPAL